MNIRHQTFGKNGGKRPPDASQLHGNPPQVTSTNTLTFEHYADETTDRETPHWPDEHEDATEFEQRTKLPTRDTPSEAVADYLRVIEKETDIKIEAVLEYLRDKKTSFETTDDVLSALERDRKLRRRTTSRGRPSKATEAANEIAAVVKTYENGQLIPNAENKPKEARDRRIEEVLKKKEPSLSTYYKIRDMVLGDCGFDLNDCSRAVEYRRELQE